MNSKTLAILLLILAGIVFVVGSTVVIYRENLIAGSTDIYPTWQGGKLFWEEGVSPYAERVGEESQREIYGRLAEGDEDEFQFVYPFYLIFYMGPLPLLEFDIAAAIFMEILLILLAATLAMSLDMIGWLPKPVTLGMMILFVIMAYFSVRGLLLGQPAFLAYFFHIVAYWALARRRDRLAGVMLALSTIKPQTGYLIVPLLLIWAWWNQRRLMVYAFVSSFGLLMGASFVLFPAWFMEWINRTVDYSTYTERLSSMYILTHVIDGAPDILTAIAQVILAIILLFPVARFWRRAVFEQQYDDFLWGMMLTMAATLIVAPRVATTYYVELYPAIFVGMMLLEKRSAAILVGGTLILIAGYWILHIVSLPSDAEAGREASIVYVAFPMLVYFWLLWRRQDWKGIDILRRNELEHEH